MKARIFTALPVFTAGTVATTGIEPGLAGIAKVLVVVIVTLLAINEYDKFKANRSWD